MAEGLTASAGAVGISEILSVITSAPKSRLFVWYSREMGCATPAGKLQPSPLCDVPAQRLAPTCKQ